MKKIFKKVKKAFNKPWKIIVLILMVLVIANYTVDGLCGVNVIESGVKKVLAYFRVFTEEVKSVSFEEEGFASDEQGTFKVTKSAEWTGIDTAKVRFDVNTQMVYKDGLKDVVFVLDSSGSMSGEKMILVKNHAKLVSEKLLANSNNRVALIRFDDDAEILSGFTNDFPAIYDKIEAIATGDNTNYYAALLKVKEVLRGYRKQNGRELVVLFLTDGYPNMNNPNQAAQYRLLKKKYPYMSIQGIQYEMGVDIVDEIKNISDNQFLMDLDQVDNILFDAVYNPEYYEGFEIVDYIDNNYFYLESVDDVTVPFGSVSLTEEDGTQKVIWTVGEKMWKTGSTAYMEMNLKLKEEYVGNEGYYPTNLSETVTSKLYDKEASILGSDLTPVLKAGYKVTYDPNPPSECSIDSVSETHYAFEKVTKTSDLPTCEGYVFKGYEFKEEVETIGSNKFIMPTHDVTLYGTWTKVGIAKTMDGTLIEKQTLYNSVISKVISDDSSINYAAKSSSTNGRGLYKIASSGTNGTKPIYFYRGAVTDNNVVFAGYCWQIVRTTETGGIKLIYNGKPTSEGYCTASVDQDETNTATIKATFFNESIGQSTWNTSVNSLAYMGYTYHSAYTTNTTGVGTRYYGKNVTYDTATGKYSLTSPSSQSYSNALAAARHYTCVGSSATSCTQVRYVYRLHSDGDYSIVLSEGETIESAIAKMTGTGLTKDNQSNSSMKTFIDNWYEANLLDYTSQLEDTVFCNDRTTYALNGWSRTSTTATATITFNARNRAGNGTPTLTCSSDVDKYTTSTENGNGLLDYPVGLLTSDEVMYAGGDYGSTNSDYYLYIGTSDYSKTGVLNNQLLFSPSTYYGTGTVPIYMYIGNGGELSAYNINFTGYSGDGNGYNVRPVISLKPETMYLDGDGSLYNPYVVIAS